MTKTLLPQVENTLQKALTRVSAEQWPNNRKPGFGWDGSHIRSSLTEYDVEAMTYAEVLVVVDSYRAYATTPDAAESIGIAIYARAWSPLHRSLGALQVPIFAKVVKEVTDIPIEDEFVALLEEALEEARELVSAIPNVAQARERAINQLRQEYKWHD